jgi:hypothetical protein
MKPKRRHSYQSHCAPHWNRQTYRLCCVAQPIFRDGWCAALDRFVSAVTLAPFRYSDVGKFGWFLCFLALTIWSFRYLRLAVSLYGLGALALPYFTVDITEAMNRYVLVCLPAFMCMGILCEGRPWLTCVLIGIFAALLLQTTASFSQWYWVG